MYYKENVNILGESESIIYGNMYINSLQFGCKYNCQNMVYSHCPDYLKNNIVVPDFFKILLSGID